ncbi:MAG: glycogen debranching protein GlgX [Myxococcota bacterium]
MSRGTIEPGEAAPLGSSLLADGVNFSVYAPEAQRMELVLFDAPDAPHPSEVIPLDASKHRTFHYWHALVPGLRAGQVYAYRVVSRRSPHPELDPAKLLIDPYARLLAYPSVYDRAAASRPGNNESEALRSVVVDMATYDWEGDQHPHRSFRDTIIYEMHVRGFTMHPTSGVSPDRRGTFGGIIDKIPYLQSLGITAVELMPVFAFDPDDAPAGRKNYWGYSPISFFAPHAAYSSQREGMGPIHEFRDMVKALHRAGLEVILDVVYNHTAEGGAGGPTFGYRGLANDAYYILSEGLDTNYTGTGNTLNANHSVTRHMIQDSLRFWVHDMHVDGFRFDLASILMRDEQGHLLRTPHTLYSIETDPYLVNAKLIAEPWDAAGLYQVGSFIGDRWREWNGRFRDDVRSFVRSDPGMVPVLANRVLASPDLYEKHKRTPEQAINFVTCHDGFTLNDLVSYNIKHNEANGEDNRDGHDHNLSWNHGIEGPTEDPAIEALRKKQIKNFLGLTLISAGVPMLLMGDEVRRTQHGNNNAYCQDNELSWFDWSLVERNGEFLRFVRELTAWRHEWRLPRDEHMLLTDMLESIEVEWHGIRLLEPDWSYASRSIAMTIVGGIFHAIFNAYWESLDFELPECASGSWRRFMDTSRPSPHDICPFRDALDLENQATYRVAPRSLVVLIS